MLTLNSIESATESTKLEQWQEDKWITVCCPLVSHNPRITAFDHPEYEVAFNLLDNVTLMVHQWYATWWCLRNERSLWNGGIVGDVMGLGKVSNLVVLLIQ